MFNKRWPNTVQLELSDILANLSIYSASVEQLRRIRQFTDRTYNIRNSLMSNEITWRQPIGKNRKRTIAFI